LADWPILERTALREGVQRYLVRKHSWLASATAGASGSPLTVHRSLRCLAAGQAFIDDLLGVWDVTFASARIARLRSDNVKPLTDHRPPFGVYRNRGRMLVLSSNHLSLETAPWFIGTAQVQTDVVYAHPGSSEF
jgi:hypothetical protein